jgi:hypothetical protein
MKILLVFLLVAAGAAYGFGVVSLSERGANRFLDDLERLSLSGKGEEYCARLHEDLRVSIRDHSADPPADFDGGREDFCDFVTYAMKGFPSLGISMDVHRRDFTVTRDWLHPWTAQVSYHEDRTATMSKVRATVHTLSSDRLTLVQTFDGIKLIALESEVELAP